MCHHYSSFASFDGAIAIEMGHLDTISDACFPRLGPAGKWLPTAAMRQFAAGGSHDSIQMRGTGWDVASENGRLARWIRYSGNDVIGISQISFLKLLF